MSCIAKDWFVTLSIILLSIKVNLLICDLHVIIINNRILQHLNMRIISVWIYVVWENVYLRLLLSKLLSAHVINNWVWSLHLLILCFTFIYSQHFLMMDKYLRRKTLNDPLMHQSFNGSDSLNRVPFKALAYKILKRITLAKKYFLQWLARRYSQIALRIFWQEWLICLIIEKDILTWSLGKNTCRR